MKKLSSVVFMSVVTLGSVASGCLHFDKTFSGVLKEGTKGALLFHDGTNAHLVVKTELTATKGQLPGELAWVMPFPALPSKYEEVSPAVFTELASLAVPDLGYGAEKGRGRSASLAKDAIKIHDVAVAGDYTIQPIEITAESDGKEFNDWLSKNSFNAMPQDLQRTYLHKGAFFLAIRVKLSGKTSHLKPIHIVYPAADLSFPLKFTHDTRTFDVDLYTITATKISATDFSKKFLTQIAAVKLSKGTIGMSTTPELAKLVASPVGFLTKFEGRKLNTATKRLRDLAKDPTFTP